MRRVRIPKSGGGVRELGIPTVTDRLIQQALLQVLQSRIDPGFSEHSYGFRPGRRAHDAVLEARRHVEDGYRVVVDVDLERPGAESSDADRLLRPPRRTPALITSTIRTARCGPACRVVWEGIGQESWPPLSRFHRGPYWIASLYHNHNVALPSQR